VGGDIVGLDEIDRLWSVWIPFSLTSRKLGAPGRHDQLAASAPKRSDHS
jgi:hypothetical protein